MMLARCVACATFTLIATNARTQENDDHLPCRNPYDTARLLETVIAQWETWTVQSLVTFWPDSIEALGPASTDNELPTEYGRYIGLYGQCGEVFSFTRAKRGNAQYLESVEVRHAAATLEDVELAGKAFLRSFGKPFDLLADAYDEWRLDDDGAFHRDYHWEEPEIHLGISIERSDLYLLTMLYKRSTWLDRAPPDSPETPFKIAITPPDPRKFPLYRLPCNRYGTTEGDPNAGFRLADLVKTRFSLRAAWFEVVPESDADFLVVVGAHWGEAERCGGVGIPIPGLQLGTEYSEQGPDWRDLETLEESAEKLAENVQDTFRKHYWRFRQFHP